MGAAIGFAIGVGAGFAAFLLDLGLAVLFLGYWLPLRLPYPLAYMALGGVLALGLRLLFLRSEALPGRVLFAATLLLLYLLPVFERVRVAFHQGRLAHPIPPVLAGLIACVGLVLWTGLLGWLAASRRDAVLERGSVLAALTVALGLAVNRNLVGSLSDPRALIADVVVVGGFVVVAWWMRRAGWRAPATAGVLILVTGIALHLWPDTRSVPTSSTPTSSAPTRSVSRSSAGALSERPNLVLVILDTLRQDVFRDVVDRTEEGRRFREAIPDAAWFDHAIAAAPWTAPSVGTIHTGLYPVEHGFGRRTGPGPSSFPRMDANVLTLAQYLGNRGYRTAGLVTNALLHPDSGIGRGFQRYEVLQAATHKLPILLVLVKGGWIGHELYQPADIARRRLGRWLDDSSWLEAEGPYFLWVHLMDPHQPYHPHPELPPEPGTERLEDERRYREETRFTLQELTRLLEDLDRSRTLLSHTLLVIVGDHGEMFGSDDHFSGVVQDGEPKVTGHGHAFYEELVHIPLVIRPPGGLGEERRIREVVSHVDLFPTLVEELGLEIPHRLASRFSFGAWLAPGWSESPTTSDEPLVRSEPALVSMNQHGPLHRSLRTATRKLIYYPGRERPDELYDLVEDPREQGNLAPEHPEEVAAAIALQQALWARLQPAEDTPPVELDAETRRQLQALGYLQ